MRMLCVLKKLEFGRCTLMELIFFIIEYHIKVQDQRV